MTLRLSSRLGRVKQSTTMAITDKAKEMRSAGIDVIAFAAGEPDFDTPEHIKDAARAALDAGVSKYTAVLGTIELRRAIAHEMYRAHGVDLALDQILVSCGAKQGLFNIFMALLDPGDEIIIPAPYWVSYPDQVLIAGGNPVIVDTAAANNFALDAAAFAGAITDRTRALVLNTPCNPTGSLYSRPQLEAIAEVCIERNILVISDDIYRSLVYGDADYTSMASLSPEMAALTIIVDGVSKTYAMTGWRIGWTVGPVELIKSMAKIQGQSTSCATRIAQVAAAAALDGPQDCVAEMRRAFDERRLEMVKRLRAIPGVVCAEPEGAFYTFPDITAYLGKHTPDGREITDDIALCQFLLEVGKAATVPGSAFGVPGHIRLSYAVSLEDIKRGCDRITEAMAKLS